MKKIVAISDTHGSDFLDIIPECDILLIGGDISPVKMPHDFNSQRGWFRKRFIPQLIELRKKCGNIVLTAGNHDTFFYECSVSKKENSEIRSILPSGVFYLNNNGMKIHGINIYGTPFVNLPIWGEAGPPVWNFASSNHSFFSEIISGIPSGVDIILSHGPAYGYADQILDENLLANAFAMYKDRLKAEHLGVKAFAENLKNKRFRRLKYFLSGHIHSAEHEFVENEAGVKFACISVLDENYKLRYDPKIIEIE